ncbi:MAG: hypothetical protein Q9170_003408 [Blastenia crenularia]
MIIRMRAIGSQVTQHPHCAYNYLCDGYLPKRPADFHTKVIFTDTQSLNPLDVYRFAILYFHGHVRFGWQVPVPHEGVFLRRGCDAFIFVSKLLAPGYTLKIGDILYALYDGVVAMSRDRFQPSVIEVYTSKRMIGKVFISRASTFSALGSNLADTDQERDIAPNAQARPGVVDISYTDDSGRYTDPSLPSWAIEYKWGTSRVDSGDMFTAIIEGIIIVAYDGAYTNFDHLNAVSATGHCALNVHETTVGRIPAVTTGTTAATLLFMLGDMVVMQRRFADLSFTFVELEKSGKQNNILEGFFDGIGAADAGWTTWRRGRDSLSDSKYI